MQQETSDVLSPQRVLVQWANEQEPWIHTLVKAVLERQGPIEGDVIDESFENLLQTLGSKDDTTAVDVPPPVEGASPTDSDMSMTLDQLSDVVGVNALAANQTIEFGKQLTVLFGQNGSGKTGYARIIKQAAGARNHDDILGNVLSDITLDQPQARFDLTVDGIHQTVNWRNGTGIAPLNRISVFDSQTATLHVDSDLEYIFTPAELTIFNHVTSAIQAVQERINSERETCQSAARLPSNLFTAGTRVYDLVQNLGPETLLALRTLADLEEGAEECLQQKQAEYALLKSGSIDEQRVGLQRQLDDLDGLGKILSSLQLFDAARYNNALETVTEAKSAVAELRTALFNTKQLAGEPDEVWQDFIKAGQALVEHRGRSQYPQEDDICLYCRQPLEADALALLRRYGEFLKDAAQGQLQAQLQTLENSIPELTKAQLQHSQEALSAVEGTSDSRQSAVQLLVDTEAALLLIESRQICTYLDLAERSNDLTLPIQDLRTRLSAEIEALTEKQSNQEKLLPELRSEVEDTEDRIKLRANLEQIEQCVANTISVKRLDDLAQTISNSVRRSLTKAANRSSEDFINRDFKRRFKEECASLKAPAVKLDFKGKEGSTHRKKDISGHHPSKILSEGEQKMLALADFLAESCMRDSKYPIIFDDPVSSLDYRRRKLIAKRLARLAEERQVVVFTHNIIFAAELLECGRHHTKQALFMRVSESGTQKGLVTPDVETPLDTPQKLKNRIDKTIGLALDADPTTQGDLIDKAYDLMRSWCEVFTEQELLGDVCRRSRPNVIVAKLKGIKVDRLKDAIAILPSAVSDISGYIRSHSHPPEQQNVSRTIDELQQDWDELKQMSQQYRAS